MNHHFEPAPVALDHECGFAPAIEGAAAAEEDGIDDILEVCHRVTIDRLDVIASLQPSFGSGTWDDLTIGQSYGGADGTELCGCQHRKCWLAREPHDAGKSEGEEDVKYCAGSEHDHPRGITDGRKFFDVHFAFALDGAQIGELWKQDV